MTFTFNSRHLDAVKNFIDTTLSVYKTICHIHEGDAWCTITCPNNVADMIMSFIIGRNSYMWESAKGN